MKNIKYICFLCALFVLASCGSGNGVATYSVGGKVSGLQPTTTLVLQLTGTTSGTINKSITANGPFTFGTKIEDGESYTVTVKPPGPAGQGCNVNPNGGAGTIASADVTNLAVVCDGNLVVITADLTAATAGEHPDWSPWKTDHTYVIAKNDFYVLTPLTIEPGAVVKFYPNVGPMLTLRDSGVITANGTATQPIIFTSLYDDTHGIDANGADISVTPAPGDWGEISTNGVNGSFFNNCEFYYGGSGGRDTTLEIYGSTATVKDSIFAHNRSIQLGALSAATALEGTIIQGNTFYDNGRPLAINDTFSVDDSNVFSKDLELPNKFNGIFLSYPAENFIGGTHVTWEETEVAFVVQCASYISLDAEASLKLGDDVAVKFSPSSCQLRLDQGVNQLVGSDNKSCNDPTSSCWARVIFTSYHDDSAAAKGDTDGDGGVVSPQDGDWLGIYDNGTSTWAAWPNIHYDATH
jgi:hypothetical protein